MSSQSNQTSSKVASQSLLDPHHKNPFAFDASDPLVLFIVQAVIIISLCNVLGFALKRIRQPKVISEVIGGIILGPTAMGRIPHFTNAIFPKQSISYLSLVANIGLVLFLFIIGLEVDLKLLKKNSKSAIGIGMTGLIVPFGIGALVSIGIYDRFIDQDLVKFSHFLLFICVAFSITAFPVLCRILTELKLLQTDVGASTLAAGVTNDVIGWVLLALSVTLVNSGAGITALYVMLVVLGWILFLALFVRPVFLIIARKSGSFESGPTPGVTCLVLLLTFFSAWFTQILGVHAIFGGFLVGAIMPHDGGFANKLASKIEDLVTVFFLPLFFTLSGLSTDLGLLKDGSIWGWTVCVLLAAEISKFVPCFAAAMWTGMDWRESGAVGSLMACKGLVELIVLNIGLSAGVLNSSVFAMFVLMAVVTTFITTPLCLAFYPESYRIQKAKKSQKAGDYGTGKNHDLEDDRRSEFMVVLSQLEHLPIIMASFIGIPWSFVKLLQLASPTNRKNNLSTSLGSSGNIGADRDPTDRTLGDNAAFQSQTLTVSALRLQPLGERTSDVMKANEVEETAKHDPILNIFRTFACLSGVKVPSVRMSIVPDEGLMTEISRQAAKISCQFIVIPWYTNLDRIPQVDGSSVNPIEKLLSGSFDSSPRYANLIRSTFQNAVCDAGVLIDSLKSSGDEDDQDVSSGQPSSEQGLFCAFLGGPDDRLALSLVLQISQRSNVPTQILRVIRTDNFVCEEVTRDMLEHMKARDDVSQIGVLTIGDTVYDQPNQAQNLASESADNLMWQKAIEISNQNCGNIKIDVIKSATPFKTVIDRVKDADGDGLMVFCGRSRQGGESHRSELSEYLREQSGSIISESQQPPLNQELVQKLGIVASLDVRKSLGDLTSGLVASGLKCKIMVVQSSRLKSDGAMNLMDNVFDKFKSNNNIDDIEEEQ
ncbi:Sodium/hydrogen exchanger family-domain-containing protein [Phakopsora pachyrhizi]|uniref:Sodium/hydrogen exchanger family-domain-containing protein n=1 Tax=Phakopsora pachyrhizi TaxID=170000 RepID=A0AAV0ANF5_PHAPC|nr:Sodium/hydrogen exchanger family-domain-containing protein [Phakopsora pachyrhizi]CAH7668764.1 Sodium/hydrogen exchanger family-domain-containing protein [Phakopsora pachyrhizi]